MIISIALLLVVGLMIYYAFVQRNSLPVNLAMSLVILTMAAAFIVSPQSSDPIAQAIGVDRGADLITYVIEVCLVCVAVHYYTQFVRIQSEVTSVVRKLALLEHRLEMIEPPPAPEPPRPS